MKHFSTINIGTKLSNMFKMAPVQIFAISNSVFSQSSKLHPYQLSTLLDLPSALLGENSRVQTRTVFVLQNPIYNNGRAV